MERTRVIASTAIDLDHSVKPRSPMSCSDKTEGDAAPTLTLATCHLPLSPVMSGHPNFTSMPGGMPGGHPGMPGMPQFPGQQAPPGYPGMPAPQPMMDPQMNPQVTLMLVNVPPNVRTGEQMVVMTPTGQQYMVIVPQGAGPGSQFQIAVPRSEMVPSQYPHMVLHQREL